MPIESEQDWMIRCFIGKTGDIYTVTITSNMIRIFRRKLFCQQFFFLVLLFLYIWSSSLGHPTLSLNLDHFKNSGNWNFGDEESFSKLCFFFRISSRLFKSGDKVQLLDKALDSKDVKVKYIHYDWTHNDKKWSAKMPLSVTPSSHFDSFFLHINMICVFNVS